MKDLIDESSEDLTVYGYETTNLKKFGMTCSKLFIETNAKAKKLGFDKGHYFILNTPLLSEFLEEHRAFLLKEIFARIDFLFKENKIKKSGKILFVGIGNPQIIADSFGVKTVEKIKIEPFKKSNKIFKIMPNTFSNTGINAFEIIKVIVEVFDISAVFLFDSLATDSISRLGCSIQFNDAGLTPGSAMNNFGMPINKAALNVPCFSIGVPMMISAESLNCQKDIILTEKDVKEKVEFLSDVVAEVIDKVMAQ